MTQERRLTNLIKAKQIELLNLSINSNISDPEDLEEEIQRVAEKKYELEEEIKSLIQESLLYSADLEEFQTI